MSEVTSRSLRMMPEPAAAGLLAAYGVDYVPHVLAGTPDEAAAAARALGCPVVLKVVSADVVHKSDVGGVVLDVGDEQSARAAFEEVVTRVASRVPGARIDGVLVCEQVTGPRVELIVGGIRDATFGATVMIGAGGVFAEVLGDVSFRLAPLHESDGADMLMELRAYKTLTGYRDVPLLDTAAVARTAAALGDLLLDHPEVAEVDLNPVLVLPEGCKVVDARIMTAAG